jgi:hypothetical protein
MEAAFGGNVRSKFRPPRGAAARPRTLNANASDPAVDFVMLACPHAALEQLRRRDSRRPTDQRQYPPVDLHVAPSDRGRRGWLRRRSRRPEW